MGVKIGLTWCSRSIPLCDKHHDRRQLGGVKDLFGFHFQVTVNHGGRSRQELTQELKADTTMGDAAR